MQLNVKQTILYKFESVNKAAKFFNVSPSTVYRWIQSDQLPTWAYDKLQRNSLGSLVDFGKAWKQWNIQGEHLISPLGVHIHIEQLLGLEQWLLSERKDITPVAVKHMRERYKKQYYKR